MTFLLFKLQSFSQAVRVLLWFLASKEAQLRSCIFTGFIVQICTKVHDQLSHFQIPEVALFWSAPNIRTWAPLVSSFPPYVSHPCVIGATELSLLPLGWIR